MILVVFNRRQACTWKTNVPVENMHDTLQVWRRRAPSKVALAIIGCLSMIVMFLLWFNKPKCVCGFMSGLF